VKSSVPTAQITRSLGMGMKVMPVIRHFIRSIFGGLSPRGGAICHVHRKRCHP